MMLVDDTTTNLMGTSTNLDPSAGVQGLQNLSDLNNLSLSQSDLMLATTIDSSLLSLASAVDFNETFDTATDAGTLTSTLDLSGHIGANESHGRDAHDFWKFSVASDNKVSLSLSNLSSDAGLALYNSAGDLLTYSNYSGATSESMSRWLGQGDYYALIYSYDGWGGDTDYLLGMQTGTQLSGLIADYSVHSAVSSRIQDGILNRNDMIDIFRSSEDFDRVDGYEVNDFRNIIDDASAFGMADHVRVLSNKLANGNVANTVSGIGDLFAGSSAWQMESLIGKWFLGNDRPDAQSFDGTTTYTYQFAQGSLFQNGISHTDVEQGDVGNCYFMASLGATAHQKSNYIQDMFIDNGDNTFTVRFFKDGAADYVTVDRFLPTNVWGQLVFADSGSSISDSNNELWVALAEKAYAQVNEENWIAQDGQNSYQGLSGGWPKNSMNHITGIGTAQNNVETDFLFFSLDHTDDIINAYNSGKMVALNTNVGSSDKTYLDPDSLVVANHSYVMTGYNSGTDTFTLYNPWGNTVELSRGQIQSYFRNWDSTIA